MGCREDFVKMGVFFSKVADLAILWIKFSKYLDAICVRFAETTERLWQTLRILLRVSTQNWRTLVKLS